MKRILALFLALLLLTACGESAPAETETVTEAEPPASGATQMYQYSTTVETEKPELDETTKALIAAYRRDPTQENYDALRAQVGVNYDAVLAKKMDKLEELKQTAKEQSKIDEMQNIVDEMVRDREDRIDATMLRFADPRLNPYSETADGFVPVMGAGENIYIAATPVTIGQFRDFLSETNLAFNLPEGADDLPITNVSYTVAEDYCAYLSKNDPTATYRLPTEAELEFAAGHMPKDVERNCANVNGGLTSVYAYPDSVGASGGLDFWGNVWEWTSTDRDGGKAVKGGAYDSPATDCRTENREQSRDPASHGYPNVGFRPIMEPRS